MTGMIAENVFFVLRFIRCTTIFKRDKMKYPRIWFYRNLTTVCFCTHCAQQRMFTGHYMGKTDVIVISCLHCGHTTKAKHK